MSEPNGNTGDKQAKGTRGAGSVLDLAGLSGLSEEGAKARLVREGPNELPAQKKRSLLAIGFGVVREPMFLMLVAAGIIYLLMGEPADALMLIGFVLVVMAITIVQEQRTERALEALRDLSSPRAMVIRDGVHRRIAGHDVVRGDFVVLCDGEHGRLSTERRNRPAPHRARQCAGEPHRG